jgi:plastocyanin
MMMNNKIIVGVILAIVVIGGVFYFSKNQYQPSQQQSVNQQPTTQQPQNKVEANAITIKDFAFNPGTLTVKQGTKVTWTNQDSMIHKIKSDTFNSSDLNQGDKFEFTFDKKGSFDYVCGIHPSMSGKIVVE